MSSRRASPVKDVSVAGRRAGLNPEARSGLWLHVARAVEALRPHLLVVENVRGLLTSPAVAASAGEVERCQWCLGDDPTQKPTSSDNPAGKKDGTRCSLPVM
ncbi:DNA cytosine methyltransferase [Streptomyces sp. NRRL WC-3742]|uniref:DNA cytosine methyltransferase n=1 Tax=Streptomyces sp. NRRL WC-3742 TaxID=1463934 RepID=UPI003B631CB5